MIGVKCCINGRLFILLPVEKRELTAKVLLVLFSEQCLHRLGIRSQMVEQAGHVELEEDIKEDLWARLSTHKLREATLSFTLI